MMDLRQLRTFIHVAELGSFSKAAERLRIAQPALSRQIRVLETELRVQLLVRHGRGVRLTDAGAVFLDRASGILRQIEQTRADVAAEAGDVSGEVSIGMPPSVGFVLTGPLVASFRRSYPKVRLKVVEGVGGFVHEWMMGGKLDVAILYEPSSTRHLEVSPMWSECLYLVGSAQSGLTEAAPVPFADLEAVPLILPSAGHGLRGLLERQAARVDMPLSIEIEADAMRIQKDLTVRGLGFTVLPLASVKPEVEAGRLSAAPIVEPIVPRRVIRAFPADRPVSRAARLLGDDLVSVVRQLVAAGEWPGLEPETPDLTA